MLVNLSFGTKLRLLGVMVLACASGALLFVAIQNERSLYRQKTERTRDIVQSATTLIEHHVHDAATGRVPLAEAQAAAIAEVRDLRYGKNDYFWINDMTPRMVMHPMKPELEGKDLGDMQDPKGLRLFVAFVDIVKQSGEGEVRYLWPKPGASKPVPKLSYVKGVPEWGWVVGSGVYLDDVQAAILRTRMTLLCVFAFAWLASWLMTHVVTEALTRNLNRLKDAVKRAADGDLSVRADVTSRDELGMTAEGVNSMLTRFQATLAEVHEAASRTTAAANELSQATQAISGGAQLQASHLEETASSLEEMTSAVKQNADNAQQAAQLAQGAREVAEKGGQVVGAAVTAMGEINASSRKIADIITAIDEIAFQTNLLALNAAVEAARAGEQGRGFAVVAGEVRNLAQRSASAAKEIKGLIQDSVAKVESGSQLVNQSGSTLEEIVTSVKRVTDIVAEIAASSREQSAGIEQVNTAVTQMDAVTQSNASQTEELAGTADGLSAQAQQMMALVRKFKLGEGREAAGSSLATPVAKPAGKVVPMRRAGKPRATAAPVAVAAKTGTDGGFEEF